MIINSEVVRFAQTFVFRFETKIALKGLKNQLIYIALHISSKTTPHRVFSTNHYGKPNFLEHNLEFEIFGITLIIYSATYQKMHYFFNISRNQFQKNTILNFFTFWVQYLKFIWFPSQINQCLSTHTFLSSHQFLFFLRHSLITSTEEFEHNPNDYPKFPDLVAYHRYSQAPNKLRNACVTTDFYSRAKATLLLNRKRKPTIVKNTLFVLSIEIMILKGLIYNPTSSKPNLKTKSTQIYWL